MNPSQYPGLYQVADRAAQRAERAHFWTLRAEIILLVTIAALASIAWDRVLPAAPAPATATAVVLVVLVGLGVLRHARRYDRVWFSCRLVAESVKVETWLYMMKAESYQPLEDSPAEKRFLNQLKSLLEAMPPEARGQMGAEPQLSGQISDFMREVRREPVAQRRTLYRQTRVQEQRAWYANRAASNARRESWWFFLTFALQMGSAGIAIWIITTPSLVVNPVGIATTLAASGGSWSNARSYRELAQSYGMISQELGILDDESVQVSDESELAAWVGEVERTISREHTLWIRRRTA